MKTLYDTLEDLGIQTQTDINIGDEVLMGKWKNKRAIVKGFGTDKNNQPTLKTNKGEISLYKVRIPSLMPEKKA